MGDVTTYCSLWKLSFPNRNDIHLTDHDNVIVYEDETYVAQNSAEGALTETKTGLSVDSGGLRTSLILPGISAKDIRDGILDRATLSEFRYDWRKGEVELIHQGRIGTVSFSGDDISVEWLGQVNLLDQSTGRVFSRQCDAHFGDARCGLNAANFGDGTSCPRTFDACRDQFSNTVNFRGFPYLLGDDVLHAGVRHSDRRDGSSRYR